MIQRLKVSIRPHDGGGYIFFYFILISFNLRTNETAYGKLTSFPAAIFQQGLEIFFTFFEPQVVHLPLINLTCLDNRELHCRNNGICVSRRNNEFMCSCPTPYCGNTCAGIMPFCKSEPSNNASDSLPQYQLTSECMLSMMQVQVVQVNLYHDSCFSLYQEIPRSLDCNSRHLACKNKGRCVYWKPM